MRWIIILIVLIFTEYYAYKAFQTAIKIKWILYTYEVISLIIICYIVYRFTQYDARIGQTQKTMTVIALGLLMILPKIIISIMLFGEDLYRLLVLLITYFINNDAQMTLMPERRKFISQLALGLAAIPFGSMLYGIFKGKYNFRVIHQTIFFDELPNTFDGFKIIHISDIHSGSLNNVEKIKYAIDLINDQSCDIILFTGDLVNSKSEEMIPWIDTFKKIKRPIYGKYSVLGNHDYGEYIRWSSENEKETNFTKIKDLHRKIDFELLNNRYVTITKEKQKIVLVGVENWGHNFKKAGDLTKAAEGLKKEDFKILMSHDPSHWEYEVKNHPLDFHLTLSGHTHGMQFGVEIPNFFHWSPAQYVYKQWAGLYKEFGKYIYVNRGFGFHAFPGRVGIWPEITVLKLKNSANK